jgi:hypothetical protein
VESKFSITNKITNMMKQEVIKEIKVEEVRSNGNYIQLKPERISLSLFNRLKGLIAL